MANYLFANLQNVFENIDKSEEVLLFLDYDGTLVSFQNTPQQVVTPNEVKIVLLRLIQIPRFTVVIVSGRKLSEIKQLLNIEGLSFAALHGLHIELSNGKTFFFGQSKNIRCILEKINEIILYEFRDEKGVFIENKEFTLAFHYRMVSSKKVKESIRKFVKIIKSIDTVNSLDIIYGSKVVEVIPNVWNKGKAVEFISRYACIGRRAILIYIGDNGTDEDAFKFIRNRGISIFVSNDSKKSTTAEYWLRDPNDVLRFLQFLSNK